LQESGYLSVEVFYFKTPIANFVVQSFLDCIPTIFRKTIYLLPDYLSIIKRNNKLFPLLLLLLSLLFSFQGANFSYPQR